MTIEPYKEQLKLFREVYIKLITLTATPNDVNDLLTEEDELEFAKAFRGLMRLKNVLDSFT
jgi:type I restriction enzyme R subunit